MLLNTLILLSLLSCTENCTKTCFAQKKKTSGLLLLIGGKVLYSLVKVKSSAKFIIFLRNTVNKQFDILLLPAMKSIKQALIKFAEW